MRSSPAEYQEKAEVRKRELGDKVARIREGLFEFNKAHKDGFAIITQSYDDRNDNVFGEIRTTLMNGPIIDVMRTGQIVIYTNDKKLDGKVHRDAQTALKAAEKQIAAVEKKCAALKQARKPALRA